MSLCRGWLRRSRQCEFTLNSRLDGKTIDMHLSETEMANISASGGMIVQCSPGGHVSVNGLGVNSTAGIRGLVSILGNGASSKISFQRASSTFHSALTALADGGFEVLGNVTALEGDFLVGKQLIDSERIASKPLAVFGRDVFIT